MYNSENVILRLFKRGVWVYDKESKKKWFLSNKTKSKLMFFTYSLICKKFSVNEAKKALVYLKG